MQLSPSTRRRYRVDRLDTSEPPKPHKPRKPHTPAPNTAPVIIWAGDVLHDDYILPFKFDGILYASAAIALEAQRDHIGPLSAKTDDAWLMAALRVLRAKFEDEQAAAALCETGAARLVHSGLTPFWNGSLTQNGIAGKNKIGQMLEVVRYDI